MVDFGGPGVNCRQGGIGPTNVAILIKGHFQFRFKILFFSSCIKNSSVQGMDMSYANPGSQNDSVDPYVAKPKGTAVDQVVEDAATDSAPGANPIMDVSGNPVGNGGEKGSGGTPGTEPTPTATASPTSSVTPTITLTFDKDDMMVDLAPPVTPTATPSPSPTGTTSPPYNPVEICKMIHPDAIMLASGCGPYSFLDKVQNPNTGGYFYCCLSIPSEGPITDKSCFVGNLFPLFKFSFFSFRTLLTWFDRQLSNRTKSGGSNMEMTIDAKKRDKGTNTGKVRKSGWVPGCIYGRGMQSVEIQIPLKDMKNCVARHAKKFTLKVAGMGTYTVGLQEIQRNALGTEMLHVALHVLNNNEMTHLTVPIYFVGTAKGQASGGIIKETMHEITIKGYPKDLVDEIKVDVAALDLGDNIHVRDLVGKFKFTFSEHDMEKIIVTCGYPKLQSIETTAATTETTLEAGAEGADAEVAAAANTEATNTVVAEKGKETGKKEKKAA